MDNFPTVRTEAIGRVIDIFKVLIENIINQNFYIFQGYNQYRFRQVKIEFFTSRLLLRNILKDLCEAEESLQ